MGLPCGWVAQSVVRVLTQSARGPGFVSRHVLFTPVIFGVSVLGLQSAKGLSHRFWHGSE